MRRILDAVLRYEWLTVVFVSPVLMFPTVHPRLTVLALVVLAVVWIMRVVVRGEAWPVLPFNGALLFFVVALCVSVAVSSFPELTISKVTNLILGLEALRAMAFAIHDERSLKWGTWALLLAGLGIVGIGVISTRWSAKVPSLVPLVRYIPQVFNRLPELTEKGGVNPNQLGGVLALYVPLLGGLAVGGLYSRASKRIMRAVSLAFLVVLFVVSVSFLLLTQSRSGWAGGIVGLLVVFLTLGWTSSRRSVRTVAIVVSFGAPLVIALMICCLWRAHFHGLAKTLLTGSRVATEVGSIGITGRLEIWARSFYAMQDFPFTGIGLGTFRKVIPLLYPYFTILPSMEVPHAHDIFLQVGVDMGFSGLIAYLALLLVAGRICVAAVKRNGTARSVALGALGGLVGLHVYGLTDALALGSKPAILFWMTLGLLAGLGRVNVGELAKEVVELEVEE